MGQAEGSEGDREGLDKKGLELDGTLEMMPIKFCHPVNEEIARLQEG